MVSYYTGYIDQWNQIKLILLLLPENTNITTQRLIEIIAPYRNKHVSLPQNKVEVDITLWNMEHVGTLGIILN